MKHLKFLIFSLAFTAFLFSCETETDPCDGITCMNGGECVEGDCDCPEGYIGTNCETEERAQFIGNYNVSEACITDDYTYTMSISASTSSATGINLLGLYEIPENLSATIDGNTITIPQQSHPDSNVGTIEGSGTISGTTITITYTVSNNNGVTDNCTATLTKQ